MTPKPAFTKTERILCVLFPSCFTILLLYYGPFRYNISGLLAAKNTAVLTYSLCISAGLFLLYELHRLFGPQKKKKLFLILLAGCALSTLIIKDNTHAGAQIHLFTALLLFGLMQAVILRTSFPSSAFRIYLMGLFLSLGCVLYTLSISGMAEIAYVWDLFLWFFMKRSQG
ncbi:MAG: hypothetical protein LKE64_10795 [Solobacterium sp.]|jgi:uncharacterized membrane protein|nr:hypothetical protein [Solobacterium sp.]MCH4048287.1 hypothetical protein [Solobacterium sp.]MCH4074860.1 hypothetical protein [Solobacterium sp.]MCI1314247.1 hypothetical protein [Solobacterium sp.]MCI1346322.1 hypothetical protein [Solobacterium sp.]